MTFRPKVLEVINGGTGLASTTANQLLYSSATSVIGGLSTANNGILITSGAGAPSISSTLPSAVQGNITSTGTLGNQLNTTRCCFLAHRSANVSNVSGDSTVYTAIFDSVDFDQGSNYNNGTGTFTAPVTGKYLLCSTMYISSIGSAHTSYAWTLSTTHQSIDFSFGNAFTQASANALLIQTGSAIINMTANDTAVMTLTVSNGSKTITFNGGAITANPSTFSGYLLC